MSSWDPPMDMAWAWRTPDRTDSSAISRTLRRCIILLLLNNQSGGCRMLDGTFDAGYRDGVGRWSKSEIPACTATKCSDWQKRTKGQEGQHQRTRHFLSKCPHCSEAEKAKHSECD